MLRHHFRHTLFKDSSEGIAIKVLERSHPVNGSSIPLPIDWNDSEFTAVVVLLESELVRDDNWSAYVKNIERTSKKAALIARCFPITMDSKGLDLQPEHQAIRLDLWDKSSTDMDLRLISELTHEFCRMLRYRLKAIQDVTQMSGALEEYMEKIQVFISHSKHDESGESIGLGIRNWIYENSPLGSFFDIHDIPPGLPFGEVIFQKIRTGVVLVIHTDSYSSREWCRKELISAKRYLVPMIIVDCIRDLDPRSIPYMGNVPIIRMGPEHLDQSSRIELIVSHLLSEVLRCWLWLCHVAKHTANSPGVLFLPRPPELINLTSNSDDNTELTHTIVYPAPLIGTDEQRLFEEVAPDICMLTLNEWLEKKDEPAYN